MEFSLELLDVLAMLDHVLGVDKDIINVDKHKPMEEYGGGVSQMPSSTRPPHIYGWGYGHCRGLTW